MDLARTRLVAVNVDLLRQAHRLLGRIDDAAYVQIVPRAPSLRIGGHLRHVLEFYECFLDGVETAFIDYERRRRDQAVETFRPAAMQRLMTIVQRMETAALPHGDTIVWVRAEGEAALMSSVSRELQALSSHTVHHYALIGAALQLLGVVLEPGFGVAASTLRHAARTAAEAA
jgi:uncharacterized damage-inducible protein DinB